MNQLKGAVDIRQEADAQRARGYRAEFHDLALVMLRFFLSNRAA
jgi:hypothetical protein